MIGYVRLYNQMIFYEKVDTNVPNQFLGVQPFAIPRGYAIEDHETTSEDTILPVKVSIQ